jgi:hypothetical protein
MLKKPSCKLNVVIANISGSTGKSTFAKHGVVPHIPNAVRMCIEDWNSGDGIADIEIGAKNFYKIAAQINTDSSQSFVIDIGASNSKAMFKHFEDLELTRDLIDWWIVPTRAGTKERIDTLKTIDLLLGMSVDPSKIIVIAQMVEDVDQFDFNFEQLKDSLGQIGVFFAPQAVLFNDVFNILKNSDKSVFDIANNMPDFNALKNEFYGNEQKLIQIGHDMLIFSLARKAARNLLSVFNSTPIAQSLVQE